MDNLENQVHSDDEKNHTGFKRFKKSRFYVPLVTAFIIYEVATKGALIYWAGDKVYNHFTKPSSSTALSMEAYAEELPRSGPQ